MSQGSARRRGRRSRRIVGLTVLLCSLIGALSACRDEPPTPSDVPPIKKVMMAVTPYHDRSFLEHNSAWVRRVLATETKRPVELVVTTSYENTVALTPIHNTVR